MNKADNFTSEKGFKIFQVQLSILYLCKDHLLKNEFSIHETYKEFKYYC